MKILGIDRIKTLSGMNPNRLLIESLSEERRRIIEEYDNTIHALNMQVEIIDEGLFASLQAALKTAGKVSANAAKKLNSEIRELYTSSKARLELEDIVKGLKRIIAIFDAIVDDSPTIFKLDEEVKKEMDLIKDLLSKVISSCSARLAVRPEKNEAPAVTPTVAKSLEEPEVVTPAEAKAQKAAPEEGKFYLILIHPGKNVDAVIQTIGSYTGKNKKEALALIHAAPRSIIDDIDTKEKAEKILDSFKKIGASVQIKEIK